LRLAPLDTISRKSRDIPCRATGMSRDVLSTHWNRTRRIHRVLARASGPV